MSLTNPVEQEVKNDAGSALNVEGEVNAAEKYSLLPYAKERTASDTLTPSAGKRIQLVWVQVVPDPDGTAGNLVTISMTIGGVLTDVYKVYALGRTAVFTGDTDTDLVITLENSQPVTINMQYREIT
jgi:hypothetical protein